MKPVGKFVAALVVACLANCAAPALARAQAAPPVTVLRVARDAAAFLDSLAIDSREHGIETAGCITSYHVQDTTLVIERIAAAHYDSAGPLAIWSRHPICGHGLPSVHSHVGDNVILDEPSDVDRYTQSVVGVWAVLLSVLPNGWFVSIYE